MQIKTEKGFVDIYEIDSTEEGYETLEGYEIGLLFVEKEYRGQGAGQELLLKAIEYAGKNDLYLVCCPKDKDTDFSRLVGFYEDNGFEIDESAGEMPYPLMKHYPS